MLLQECKCFQKKSAQTLRYGSLSILAKHADFLKDL